MNEVVNKNNAGQVFVSSKAIAALIAGTIYMWLEAIFRLLGTWTTFASVYRLWQPRDGFIAAMFLTISIISIVIYLILAYAVMKKPKSIKSFTLWVIILTVSVVVAPLIGEIGTPVGI